MEIEPAAEKAATGAPGTLTYQTPADLAIPQGWTNVETFPLAQNQLWKSLLQSGGTTLLYLFVFSIANAALYLWLERENPALGILFAAGSILLLGLVLLSVLVVHVIRTITLWPHYRLVIADQGLIQTRPPAKIESGEIKGVTETFSHIRFRLRNHQVIDVPRRIENPARFRARVRAQWGLEQRNALSSFVRGTLFNFFLIGLIIFCLAVSEGAKNLLVIIACGLCTVAVGLYMFWRAYRKVDAHRVLKWANLLIVLMCIWNMITSILAAISGSPTPR